MVNKGVLERIGRGRFKLGKGNFFQPTVNSRLKKIHNFIHQQYPFVKYCIWESSWVKEFGQHIFSNNMMIVDVEKEATESVYYTLKSKYKQVFYRPGQFLLDEYINGLENVMLVRHLVTESPIQEIKSVPTITLEKLLVDIYADDEFKFLQGVEMVRIFKNAFEQYTVNQSKLLRYANRRRKKIEILDFIKNYQLAAI